jgi:hypothetical protein
MPFGVANRRFFTFLSKIRCCHSERSEESPVAGNNLINTFFTEEFTNRGKSQFKKMCVNGSTPREGEQVEEAGKSNLTKLPS